MAVAQETEPEEVVTPLVATPIASPNPVLGADDKVHLAYELVLLNMAPGDIGLKKIETLDARSDAVLGAMEAQVWQRCSSSMEVARESRSQVTAPASSFWT